MLNPGLRALSELVLFLAVLLETPALQALSKMSNDSDSRENWVETKRLCAVSNMLIKRGDYRAWIFTESRFIVPHFQILYPPLGRD
jgi:hypothetical protein